LPRTAQQVWNCGRLAHFDLVIVDCNMPVMNGYELTRAIRQHELQTRCPPCTVLGFTANAQPEEIQRCKQAGMNDCLFKPLSLSLLSQWVDGITPASTPPAFNLQNMNMLTGGNPAQSRRLLAELLKSSRLDRQELLALSPEHDRGALAVVAHKIKGAARIAQATRVIECCDALEQACAEALTSAEIARHCEASNRAMLELEQALQQQLTLSDRGTMSVP
jgi:two-component system sensor histidine kinase EvgS